MKKTALEDFGDEALFATNLFSEDLSIPLALYTVMLIVRW